MAENLVRDPLVNIFKGLQSLRGLACLLLVSFHVVGDVPTRGLHLEINHPLKMFNFSLTDLRLPLFAFISGVVFKWGKVDRDRYILLFIKYFKRLMIPYFIVGSIYSLTRSSVYSDSKSFFQLILYPIDHFWYLQANFLITISFITALLFIKNLTIKKSYLIFLITIILSIFSRKPEYDLFSILHALGIAPFFLLGHVFSRQMRHDNAPNFQSRLMVRLSASFFIILVITLRIYMLKNNSEMVISYELKNFISLALGTIAILALISFDINSTVLISIGKFSYAIFLYHVFFTSLTRTILSNGLHFDNVYIIYLITLFAGIIFPILLELLIRKSGILSLLLLGSEKK